MELRALPPLAVLALVLSGCSGQTEIQQAGSSTVLPIAEAWSEEFSGDLGARIVVSGGGTGAGFQKFCRGETDIADASRPIKDSEAADCRDNGIEPHEVEVAIDGLSVIVSDDNGFVDCLSVEQLHRIWTADTGHQANRWSDLDPAWPSRGIDLYGPGTDSGTFDYFVEAVIQPTDGKESRGRSDYTPSEDDNFIVQGVHSTADGLGYLGLAYARDNPGVRIVPIDGGEGCVEPTDANVESGAYAPLSRPLFMYTDGVPEGTLKEYFLLALSAEGQAIVREEGYIPLPAERREAELQALG